MTRALFVASPYIHAACGECHSETRAMPGSMRWFGGMGLVQRRCLVCQRVGWYFRQVDGGVFVVWKWPDQHPEHIGSDQSCGFTGCAFQRRLGKRYCYGHAKQRYRYGDRGMKPLDMDAVRRNRLAARKRSAR